MPIGLWRHKRTNGKQVLEILEMKDAWRKEEIKGRECVVRLEREEMQGLVAVKQAATYGLFGVTSWFSGKHATFAPRGLGFEPWRGRSAVSPCHNYAADGGGGNNAADGGGGNNAADGGGNNAAAADGGGGNAAATGGNVAAAAGGGGNAAAAGNVAADSGGGSGNVAADLTFLVFTAAAAAASTYLSCVWCY
ncbi:hypothetical protein ElyMa_001182300 [Elysia marginata]|uniref:Uncharacterized protein n=1 Tax=Elysia marginata TaxID=1093978 RepID=A0AAV4I349_9GAST|nr:hypothetical protein ElyMa_001182300 [Elysia marginata]